MHQVVITADGKKQISFMLADVQRYMYPLCKENVAMSERFATQTPAHNS